MNESDLHSKLNTFPIDQYRFQVIVSCSARVCYNQFEAFCLTIRAKQLLTEKGLGQIKALIIDIFELKEVSK